MKDNPDIAPADFNLFVPLLDNDFDDSMGEMEIDILPATPLLQLDRVASFDE